MPARRQSLPQVESLLAQGYLARSACGAPLQALLQPLLDAGSLQWERAGAGRRLVVRDSAALRAFLLHTFPDAPHDPAARVSGVARFRDSKALPGELPEIVCVRAWRDHALRLDGALVGAAAATATHGVFAFVRPAPGCYSLHGRVALVENAAVFHRIEELQLPVDLAIHGHGRSSNALLDWLAAQTDPGFELVHLPDYDPVGLNEFTRLHQRLGDRARLHLPATLAHAFQRFSNRDLLDRGPARALLPRLRLAPIPEVRRVLDLIEQHHAGLEQEVLLIRESSLQGGTWGQSTEANKAPDKRPHGDHSAAPPRPD